jgi:hypothetical protein
VDVGTPAAPRVVYQDGDPASASGKSCSDAYSATFSGKSYALLACSSPRAGVALYDLTAAAAISGTFQEVAPDSNSQYPDIFKSDGNLVTTWLDGSVTRTKIITRIDGVESFVVSNATGGGGFDLWDFSNPAMPRRLGGGGGVDAIGPVALWKSGSRYFVAAVTPAQLQWFEVTRVLKEMASDAGPVLAWVPMPRAFEAQSRLVSSRPGDGSVLLSFASGREPPHEPASVGLAEEALYDVSDPKAPRDITPASSTVNGVLTGYWAYSYQFGWVRASGGRFNGPFFYRAGQGVLEIHQWSAPINLPPVISSTAPTTARVKREYDYQIVASDPEGKALTYEKVAGPSELTFLAAGEVNWVPTAADVGPVPVTVAVSDGKNTVNHSWTIVVSGPATDGGSDAGTSAADAGVSPVNPNRGCGCQTASGPLAFALALWLLRSVRTRVGVSRNSQTHNPRINPAGMA